MRHKQKQRPQRSSERQLTFPGFVDGFQFLLRLVNSGGLKQEKVQINRADDTKDIGAEGLSECSISMCQNLSEMILQPSLTHQDVFRLLELFLQLLDVAVSLLHLLLQQLHLLVHLPLLLSHLHQLLELPVPLHQQLQDLRTDTHQGFIWTNDPSLRAAFLQ